MMQNQMNAAQRFLAVLGATGTAALMTLPVLAQSPQSNGVLNPNPSILNEAPYNRSNTTTETAQPVQPSVSDRCADYTTGGVGGPVDSQSQSSASRQTNTMGSAMNAPTATNSMNSSMQSRSMLRQFDGNNPSPSLAFRSNGPAGTAGREAVMNLDRYQERQSMMSSMQSSMQSSTQSNLSSAPLPTECAPR